LAFTRNPSDTSVSPATYTADGASDILLVDQQRDIAIDGSDKGDTILVTAAALSSRALYNYNVRGFAGNDTIAIDATLVQNSTINGNVGNDDIQVGDVSPFTQTIFTNSYLLGGKGDDTVTGYDVTGGELNGNIGDDTIVVDNLGFTGYNQYVGGGQGNDAITIDGNFTNSIVDGNKGIDTIVIEDGTHSDTSVNGGEGDDIIRMADTSTSKGLMINGDLGNDTILSVGGNGSTVTGGEGNDTIVSSSDAGETSSIDAGVGADLVGTDSSAAVETIVFESGDSVAATKSSLGATPGAAIAGTITFGNGIDIITGLTGGLLPTDTNDEIDIDFKPSAFTLTQGKETAVAGVYAGAMSNTDTLATDTVYAVQGTLSGDGATFTVGFEADAAGNDTKATGTDYLYIVGGSNLTLGQVFKNSDSMFVSGSLIDTDQFV